MYKVDPLCGNISANPNFDFYRIETIHPHLVDSLAVDDKQVTKNEKSVKKNEKSGKKNEKSSTKVVNNDLEAKQKSLIEKLKNFHIRVDNFIQQYDSNSKVGGGGKKSKEDSKAKPEQKSKNKSKADERKKDKAEEKKWQDAAKQEKKPTGPILTVPAHKSTASVVYSGLESTINPFGYDTKELLDKFTVTLQCQQKDKKWIDAIAKLAESRGIQISENPTGNRTIKAEYNSDNIQLTSELFSLPIKGRVAVWKSIGRLLGLFDFTDAVFTAPTNQWLRFANEFLEERVSAEETVRQLCQRLSAHDFLASNNIPTLSDLILKSLISDSTYLANNVELWIKRLN